MPSAGEKVGGIWRGARLLPGSGGSLLMCSASMDPMPPLNMMGLIHSRRWPSGSWRPKERAKPGAQRIRGEGTGSKDPNSLRSLSHPLHPPPPPELSSVSIMARPPSLTSQHRLPELVAVVRSPITGLDGNLQGSGKVPRIREAWILPGQAVTWAGGRKLKGL